MNRTLKRPMFRIGGKADGITSGLDRPGYSNGSTADIATGGISRDEIIAQAMADAKNFSQSEPMSRNEMLGRFLIPFGKSNESIRLVIGSSFGISLKVFIYDCLSTINLHKSSNFFVS